MPSRLRTKADQNQLLLRIDAMARSFAIGAVAKHEVDDVVNEVVLYCLEKLRSRALRKLPGNLQAFVRKLVKARAADLIRKRIVVRDYEAEEQATPDANEPEWLSPGRDWNEESIVAFQRAVMEKLPPRCRMAYELCRLEGLSYEDAAACMGVSRRVVGLYIVQAHRRFRDELRLDGFDARLPGARGRPTVSWRNPDGDRFAPEYLSPEPAAAAT